LAEKKIRRAGEILGLSVRVIVVTAVVMILFGIYLGALMYGENSLMVLNGLKEQKRDLLREAKELKSENQRLQKEFFELKQLQTGEE
jgi:cell division protein FtsB